MTDNLNSPQLPIAGEILLQIIKILNARAREAVGFKTKHGIPNLMQKAAETVESSDSDQAIRNLYQAIAKVNFSQWTLELKHNLGSDFVPSSWQMLN